MPVSFPQISTVAEAHAYAAEGARVSHQYANKSSRDDVKESWWRAAYAYEKARDQAAVTVPGPGAVDFLKAEIAKANVLADNAYGVETGRVSSRSPDADPKVFKEASGVGQASGIGLALGLAAAFFVFKKGKLL